MSEAILELEQQLQQATDPRVRIDFMNRLSWELRRLDSQQSLNLSAEACRLSAKIGYEIGSAESVLGMTIHDAYADLHEEALIKYHTILEVFEKNSYTDGKIKVLNAIGHSYGKLGKKEKALEAYLSGLTLSREAGNAPMTVFFLNNIGEIYKDVINVYEEALKYYNEAVHYCEKSGSTIYGIILSSIGECYHKLGDNGKALEYSLKGLLKAQESGDMNTIGYCYYALGRIYKIIDDTDKALKNLELSLDCRNKTNNKYGHAEVLAELGSLYLTLGDYPRALSSLIAALDLSTEINAAFLLGNIHKLIAEAYEKSGCFENAVHHYKKYIDQNNKIVSQELETKISALSADSKLQQAKKDAEIYKLKNVELKESYNNIAVISEIGQKITASLDIETIMNTIYDTMNTLMDATVFGIGLYDETNQQVEYKIFIEDSKRLPLFKASIHDENSIAAECIRTRKNIFINNLADDGTQTLIPDDDTDAVSRPARSLIYYPLIIEDKVLGTITVQSYKENAYTEQNLNTLKALASYITIAITNSQKTEQLKNTADELKYTLDHLQETQEYLIQSEKMAALGQLISGIAHEINTPLGAIQASINNISEYMHHTIGEKLPALFRILDLPLQQLFFEMLHSSMEKDITISSKEERMHRKRLQEQITAMGLDHCDTAADNLVDIGIYDHLEKYLPLFSHPECHFVMQVCYELSGILRNVKNMDMAVGKASKMLYALKNYAHFDRTGIPVESSITEGIDTVLALYHNQIKQGTEVIKNYSPLPAIKCFPDELNQVWTNLIHNALQAMDYKGTLEIDACQEGGYITVRITDSGTGIPEAIHDRIFDPFFTTKKQGEGSGLGLGIAKKIISRHQGDITVESRPGRTTFTVRLSVNLV